MYRDEKTLLPGAWTCKLLRDGVSWQEVREEERDAAAGLAQGRPIHQDGWLAAVAAVRGPHRDGTSVEVLKDGIDILDVVPLV